MPFLQTDLDQPRRQGADTMSCSEFRGQRDPNGKGLPMWLAFDDRKGSSKVAFALYDKPREAPGL